MGQKYSYLGRMVQIVGRTATPSATNSNIYPLVIYTEHRLIRPLIAKADASIEWAHVCPNIT